MKLRTALQGGAIFPIALAIVICVALVLRWRSMDNLTRISGQTDDMAVAISDLDHSLQQWTRTGKPEAAEAWQRNHAEIEGILRTIQSAEPVIQVKIKSMLDTIRQAGETFAALAPGNGTVLSDPGASPQHRQRLLDDLSCQNRALTADCVQIGRASQTAAMAEQQDVDLLIAICLAVLALAMAFGMLVAGRRIMQRFDIVSNGIGAIADGKTDHKLEIDGEDELDELLHSFNKMSTQLGKSQEVLRKEASEHQTAAEALRKANMILSDALVKLKRAQTQAVESARLGALSQVAHGMEHSFNNTLTPILGLSDFLVAYPEQLKDHKALTDHLKVISAAVRKARDQVDRMVEFFRPARDLKSIPGDINDLIRQTVKVSRRIWLEGPKDRGLAVKIVTEAGDLPIMELDHAALCEAVTDLIINAVEAMPRGGTINITTAREHDLMVLQVRDTGEGMTTEVLSRCLEPFFSTKGSGSAGMGLTVVAGTVKRHGGTLAIESTPDIGTTVTIKLPIRTSRMPAAAQATGTQRLKGLRVLLANDEPAVLHLCTTYLKSGGHAVETAADGTEALSKFRSGHHDVVILDQSMPPITGADLAGLIRQETPSARIILLTGSADVLLKDGARSDSVDAVISKPVSVDALNNAIAGVAAGEKPGEA
ncbi:MAG: ATP-binding protein [bacterium]